MLLGQSASQLRVRIVSQPVFDGLGGIAGVEIEVLQLQPAGSGIRKKCPVALEGGVEAGHEQLLGSLSRGPERERAERSHFGEDSKQEGQESG